jgi:hypothetical protein
MTSSTFIEGFTITLAEIAKVVGRSVAEIEAEAARLGIYVGTDWADRPAVAVGDAYGPASGALERDQEHQRRHTAWVNAHQEWEQAKEDARRGAFQTVYDEVRRTGKSNSEASDRGHRAGAAAVADFEAANPEPRFEQEPAPRRWLGKLKVGVR